MRRSAAAIALALALATSGDLRVQATCQPHLLGADRRGPAYAVARSGTMVYLGAGAALVVIDAADPEHPIERGYANLNGVVLDVASWGWTAIALEPEAIEFVDASDPANPQVVGSFPLLPEWEVQSLDARDSMVFFAESRALHIVSFANPAAPEQIGTFPVTWAADVAARTGRAYLLGAASILVLDTSDPTAPVELASVPAPWEADESITVAPSGSRLATWGGVCGHHGCSGQVAFFDLANPDLPVQRSVLYTNDDEPRALAFASGHAYVRHWSAVGIYDLSNLSNPVLEQTFSTESNGQVSGAPDPDYLLVADDWNGLRVFDVAPPSSAHEVAAVTTPHRTLDGYFAGRYAVTFNERGLRIFDVSQPDQPVLAGSWSSQVEWYQGELTRLGSIAWARSGYPYHYVVFDLSDPPAPVRLGTVGEGFAYPAPSVDRDRALVPAGPPAPILDVSDPASPLEIGALTSLGSYVFDGALAGDRAYAWTYGSSQPIRLWIFDVSQPAAPVELGVTTMTDGGRSAIHGPTLFASGGTTFATFSVADPARVLPLGSLSLPASGTGRRIALYGGRAVVGPDWAEPPEPRTFRIVDVGDPAHLSLLAALRTAGDAENVFVGPGLIGVADGEAGISFYESCAPFADGFESSDASAWSVTQP